MQLREPFTFFVDRSLGRTAVIDALRAAGENAIAHDDHFAQDTADLEWLDPAGRNGWVVLTKDARIRSNELERAMLYSASVAAFMLARGDLTGPQMGSLFVAALVRMKKALNRFDAPFIASVSLSGGVTVLYDQHGRLKRPRAIK